MNYNFDTEMDLEWAADQLRRVKNTGSALPDTPIRRVTAPLQPKNGVIADPSVSQDTTLGNALSALTVHSHNDEQCRRICESILTLLSDRERTQTHAEFVQLQGVQLILGIVKRHGDDATHVALRILDKLSRTSARHLSAAGGIDVVLLRCDKDKQSARVLEAALKVLHGLSFDTEVKQLLLRRGVPHLARSIIEAGLANSAEASSVQAYQDVHTIAVRLAARLADGAKGYANKLAV
mmetsp:Transcript_98775/g.156210  ORF Transcript_98775/g.156210 Transcript_98775/m.156210 type:complete len:237 (-) Transcript_98775:39-749(-)